MLSIELSECVVIADTHTHVNGSLQMQTLHVVWRMPSAGCLHKFLSNKSCNEQAKLLPLSQVFIMLTINISTHRAHKRCAEAIPALTTMTRNSAEASNAEKPWENDKCLLASIINSHFVQGTRRCVGCGWAAGRIQWTCGNVNDMHSSHQRSQLFPSHRAFRWVGCIKSDWKFSLFLSSFRQSAHEKLESMELSVRENVVLMKETNWAHTEKNGTKNMRTRAHTHTHTHGTQLVYAFNKTIIIKNIESLSPSVWSRKYWFNANISNWAVNRKPMPLQLLQHKQEHTCTRALNRFIPIIQCAVQANRVLEREWDTRTDKSFNFFFFWFGRPPKGNYNE